MPDLRVWFTSELKRLGFAGLEGVYDYVMSLPDEEAGLHLESLLGSRPGIKVFADTFVRNRRSRAVSEGQTASAASTATDTSLNFWDEVSVARAPQQSRKSKRTRAKERASANNAKGSNGKQTSKESFASKVTPKVVTESELATAITNSRVEQVREKIREYRKEQRVINCIRCGKIERLVQENGACSFCGAALFSLWDGSNSGLTQGQGAGSPSKRRLLQVPEKITFPVVLGRFCHPASAFTGNDQSQVPGTRRLCAQKSEEDAAQPPPVECKAKKRSSGYYARTLGKDGDLGRLCAAPVDTLWKSNLPTLPAANDSLQCQGRLVIDDLFPSVSMSEHAHFR